MNEYFHDLERDVPWLLRRGRKPGAVHQFSAREGQRGLVLHWLPPVRSRVEGYRIERTREGRHYEPVAETTETRLLVPRPPLREPWFYRVRAWNAQGEGGFRGVYLYQRRGWSRRTGSGSVLQYVAVIPGLRVTVSEQVPAPR